MELAILKSRALIEQETLALLREKEAEACYAILEGWQKEAKKLPITPIKIELVTVVYRDDIKPFGYDNSLRPSRNNAPKKMWSEL